MAKKRTLVTLAILLSLVLVATSCSGGVSKGTDELRIATDALGDEKLDPMISQPSSAPDLEVIYDSLIDTTRDGWDLSPDTGVLKKWELSSDGRTWTFYVREGIKFHDGTELTAEDVKFTLERLRSPKAVASNAFIFKQLIKEIKVVNPYKLEVVLVKPAYSFIYYASALMGSEAMIVPKAYIEQQGEEIFRRKPVGSGPYRLVEATPGRFKYEAVEKHWAVGTPKFKTITWSGVPEESTRIAMLKAGEADIISVGREAAVELKKAGFQIFKTKDASAAWVHVHQQWKGKPLNDRRVREALSVAINREEIAKYIMAGEATVQGSQLNSWDLVWEKDLPRPAYNPEKAKQLLKEAGYPNGFKLNFYFFPHALMPEAKKIAESLAGYWANIGLDVKILQVEWGSYRDMWVKKTFPDPTVGLGVVSNRVISSVSPFTASSTAHNVEDPEFTKLADGLIEAPDEATYKKTFSQFNTRLWEETINIELLTFDKLFATNDKIKQWRMGRRAFSFNMRDIISAK